MPTSRGSRWLDNPGPPGLASSIRPRLALAPLSLLLVALPAAALANSVPSCASAPCASDSGPILLLSYYRGGRNLQKLIRVVNSSHLPAHVPVYYGDYWGS